MYSPIEIIIWERKEHSPPGNIEIYQAGLINIYWYEDINYGESVKNNFTRI